MMTLDEVIQGMECCESEIDSNVNCRVEEYWGTVSMELLYLYNDALRQEINYRVKARCDYDVQKIEDYALDGLKPLTASDLPEGWKELFTPLFDEKEPLTLMGKRLYIADGAMRQWEYKKQYELRR